MEKEKPLSWMSFIGCVIIMGSLLLVFGINVYWGGQSPPWIYRSQPLANFAGIVLLVLGIILVRIGFKKAE